MAHCVVVSALEGFEHNSLQGDFGESWLEVIAAGSGILHGRPTTLDFEKADIELVWRGKLGGTTNPTVKAQVKTTKRLRTTADGDCIYDLDATTYEILRRTDHAVRRILVVFETADAELFRVTPDGTLLLGRGFWTSLEGRPSTTNTGTIAVILPSLNTLDGVGLQSMLATCGVRASTIVPEPDMWGES
jgi:hypothetical protein